MRSSSIKIKTLVQGVALSQHNLVAGSHTSLCTDPEWWIPAAGLQQEVAEDDIIIIAMMIILGDNLSTAILPHLRLQ